MDVKTQVVAVKAALSDGSASSATLEALRCLLWTKDRQSTITTEAGAKSRPRPNSCATIKSIATKRGGTKDVMRIGSDPGPNLLPKDQQRFATEVVNISLRVLTEPKSVVGSGNAVVTTGGNALDSQTSKTSRKPLEQTSGNSSPAKASLDGSKSTDTAVKISAKSHAPSSGAEVVAQCSIVAFDFLRSNEAKNHGSSHPAKLQLETGMLALIGKLISFGMFTLARKELQIVKDRLAAVAGVAPSQGPPKKTSRSKTTDAYGDSVASSLSFQGTLIDSPEITPLLATYYLHVLSVIAATKSSRAIEPIADVLHLDTLESPLKTILQQLQHGVSKDKVARQLSMLSSMIWSMCPSTNTGSDDASSNHGEPIAPMVTFRLQTLALKVRRLWWNLAHHQANVEKELIEPFTRSVTALLRRDLGNNPLKCYETICQSLESLELDGTNGEGTRAGLLSIHRTLSSLAQTTSDPSAEVRWAQAVVEDCLPLSPTHARSLEALCGLTAANLRLADDEAQRELSSKTLDKICTLLGEQLTGNGVDYEELLVALVRLINSIYRSNTKSDSMPPTLLGCAAGYAQRFARSYPNRKSQEVLSIIRTSLLQSETSEALLGWLSKETVAVFVQNGVLNDIADAARSQPLQRAFTASSTGIAFGKAVNGLLQKAVRSSSDTEIPVGGQVKTSTEEELCLLEWQIHCIVELSRRGKYQASLRNVLSKVCDRLWQIYRSNSHPVREARTAVHVLKLRETCPDIVSTQLIEAWQDVKPIEQEALGLDQSLATYVDETNTAIILMRAFAAGSVSVEDLRQTVAIWTSVVVGSGSHQNIESRIYDFDAFRSLLSSAAAYLGMVGSDLMRHQVLTLLRQLSLVKDTREDQLQSSVDLVLQSIRLGYLNLASDLLRAAIALAKDGNAPVIQRLRLHIAYAQYYLEVGDQAKAAQSLEDARALRNTIEPKQLKRHERRIFETIHGSVWYLQSRYETAAGNATAALRAARQSVKLWNSIWAGVEQRQKGGDECTAVEAPSNTLNGLVSGVSKLTLGRTEPSEHGAAFWTLVPRLCEALVHLSKLYAHHGLFVEASHYCERAISIAEGCRASSRLSEILCYKARLQIKAGHVEDSELSLARTPDINSEDGILQVKRLRAEAELRQAEGAFDEAVEKYDQAESRLAELARQCCCSEPKISVPAEQTGDNCAKDVPRSTVKSVPAKRQKVAPATEVVPRRTGRGVLATPHETTTSKSSKPSSTGARVHSAGQTVSATHARLRTSLMLDKALCLARAGKAEISIEERGLAEGLHASKYALLLYLRSMHRVNANAENDVSLNMLLETALALPSCRITASLRAPRTQAAQPSATSRSRAPAKKQVNSKAGKGAKQQQTATGSSATVLPKPDEVVVSHAALHNAFTGSTWDVHSLVQMLSAKTLVQSALRGGNLLDSRETGAIFEIELGRSTALQYEQRAVALDHARNEVDQRLQWPSAATSEDTSTNSSVGFQHEYVDILPKSWTAISMTLNDDCNELFITRYRAHETPFVVRLPFARHHGEDEIDEQTFDFATGKAELLDIIQLSNASCHNGIDITKKGAKTSWWSEREALDRRMHELLLNIERIWFGGFKGVLSDHVPQEDPMASFRRSFENILQRHLPSRKNARGQQPLLELDDRVLELFVNLGSDHRGEVDLDEALVDLLYFVVDTLQFRGERNAYDEIDFDEMVLELQEALREYHEASENSPEHDRHVVLILDRRLQVFPWESLPCLQSISVSRVGSMLALRDCIAAMTDANRHRVDRTTGTYFLNPSGDLSGTQATLEPTLSTLLKNQPKWTAEVRTAPDEEIFSKALGDSSITLYFGHGAGSQYIRPRTIKKLDQCSEVVWLMGCSSGAVTEYGQLEPFAVPHAYLLAGTVNDRRDHVEHEIKSASAPGSEVAMLDSAPVQAKKKCLAVVATLWDVTDKDIDRFSLEVGDRWGLWSCYNEASSVPQKTAIRRRQQTVLPSTPTQVAKTPKTPKVMKSILPKTPVRDAPYRSQSGSGENCSLVEAVSRSRDACYLRYLNGASPVVYGVPVYLGD